MTWLRRHLCFPLSPVLSFALAATSGLLYFSCFPPLGLWPLAWVALAPLQLALTGQSFKRSLQLGLCTGLFVCFPGLFWLVELMRTHGGFPLPLSLLFLALLSLYQAGQFGLSAWLFSRSQSNRWPPELCFPLCFALGELAFPQLFPWYLGASFHSAPVLIQTADLAGPVTVSLVALIANAMVASVLLALPRNTKFGLRAIAFSSSIVGVSVAYGAIRLGQQALRESEATALKIGIVQANVPMNLSDANGHLHYLKRHLALTSELKNKGADLVVWSESSLTYVLPEKDIDGFLSRSPISRMKVPVIVGAVLEGEGDGSSKLWNSAILLDESGRVAGRYDKHYLLAFGEYIPFGDVFPALYRLSPATQRFEPGGALTPLNFRNYSLNTNICYEDILPVFVNAAVNSHPPDLLVNLTNDAWFGDSAEPWTHLALAKLRAVEHRRYLVRSTNSGVSAVIDSSGRVRSHSSAFVEASLLSDVKLLKNRTIFERVGQAPIWALGLIGLLAAVRKRRD